MSNLSEEDKKILEKQIAKKVRSELDKEDFEDTAWLKVDSTGIFEIYFLIHG